MSARTGYFKVGVFVLLALTLGVAMLIVFGAGRFWRDQVLVETYFDESVQGVDIGTPIKYRGVTVGAVEKIDFVRTEYPLSQQDEKFFQYDRYVLVRFAIRPEVFSSFTYADAEPLKRLIEQGFRVRLASQGLTGLMYIEADYLDPTRSAPLPIAWKPLHYYVPSAPSVISRLGQSVDQVMQRIEQADLLKLALHLDELLLTATQSLHDLKLPQLNQQVTTLLTEMAGTVQATQTLVHNPEIPRLLTTLRETATEARVAMGQLQQASQQAAGLLAKPALGRTLDDIASAARSVDLALQTLPDTLQRMQRLTQRADGLLAREEPALVQTLDHLRVITQQLAELATKLNADPAQILFSVPPAPLTAP